MAAGVVLVWSGKKLMSRTFRIPPDGLVLGRELLGTSDDDRMSRSHARVVAGGNQFTITDLGSANTMAIAGAVRSGEARVPAGTIVRTGHTLWVLVDDVTPYERSIVAPPGVVSGAVTLELHRAIESLARAGKRVVVRGGPGIGRGHLARTYAAWTGRSDTIVIENISRMRPDEREQLREILQSAPPRPAAFTFNTVGLSLDPPIADLLQQTAEFVELPPLRARPDELAQVVYETVCAAAPGITCHASLIERCLVEGANLGMLVEQLTLTGHTQAQFQRTTVNVNDFDRAVQSRRVMIRDRPN